MVLRLPPITNPEKLKNLVSNFESVEKEINSCMLRRTGVEAGEANHMEVALDMNGNAILNASTDLTDGSSLLTLADADERYLNDVSEEIEGKVDKSGGSMSGTLDMGDNFLRNVASPVQEGDAATKAYVDLLEQSVMSLLEELHPLHFAEVGDEIGGGIYGGTHTDGAKTWHLIFAVQEGESSSGPKWGNYQTTTGADSLDDGLSNQTVILSDFDDGSAEAFYHCRDYTDGEGNNDYYLPARNELAKADALIDMEHPEFSNDLSAYRWSSSEFSSLNAWGRRFSDGGQNNISSKTITNQLVRPVRRIPV